MEVITLEFGDDGCAKFSLLKRRLTKDGQASSNGQTVSAALSLLDWAINEIEAGRAIGSINYQERIFTELRMPELDEVKSGVSWGTWHFRETPSEPGEQ